MNTLLGAFLASKKALFKKYTYKILFSFISPNFFGTFDDFFPTSVVLQKNLPIMFVFYFWNQKCPQCNNVALEFTNGKKTFFSVLFEVLLQFAYVKLDL